MLDLTPSFPQQGTKPESEFLQFPSDKEITKARKEGDSKIKDLSVDQIKELRIKCKWDLFFLCYGPLGYNKLDPELHGNICAWIEANKYWLYTLLLIPRSHYKSTIQTIGESIQTALPDDTGNARYPYNLGPNVRLLIVHDIHTMAQKFLRSITQHFTVNPLIVALFPELIPNYKKQKINISELELPRTNVWNESTFDTMGVGGRSQGNHYNIIKPDDIYGEAARDSKTEREGHIQWFDNIQSYLLSPAADYIRIAGTRWAFDDIYAHAMKTYGDQLKTYIRSVWKKDDKGNILKDKNGNEIPLFNPKFDDTGKLLQGFTWKSLQILRKNKKVWNAQYINDPKEGAAEFHEEWKRYFKLVGREIQIYSSPTPFSDGTVEYVSYEELNKIILADPATENESGIVVVGVDRQKRVFILECLQENLKPEQFRDKIFSLVMKYRPSMVCIEEVLFSKLYQVWFIAEMALKGIRFRVEGLKTGQQEKATRVRALANWFDANVIFFKDAPEDEQIQKLITQYTEFGATEDYHLLDALAYIARNLNDGSPVCKAGGGFRTSSNNISKDKRDVQTGYSPIRSK